MANLATAIFAPMRSFTPSSVAVVTSAAMGVATFPQVIFSVFAAELIVAFGVERWQVGALVTATGLTGALFSPVFGRVTDRIGAFAATGGTLALGFVGLSLIASAPTYIVLLGVAILTGIPQGWSNPATNALIVDNIPAGERGVVTGIKQSGVQAGTFLGGLLLPLLAGLWDWRLAIAAFLVFPFAGLVAMRGRRSAPRTHRGAVDATGSVPHSVRWIAVYGTISGLGTSAMFTFLPLFAEESEGWTATQAGWLIAGVGLLGVVARIGWGSVSERLLGHGRTLRVLALETMVSAGLLALAAFDVLPSWVLVPAAMLFAAGGIAWNAVGMLAIMDYSPPELVGRGTGLVLLGFLLGIGTGAPLMGLSVDRLGVYGPGWLGVTGLFVVCAVIAGNIHRTGTLAHS